MTVSETDICNGMRAAIAEARRWIGATTPNPPVGATALDSSGKIIAVSAHRKAGEAHAEVLAIQQCRDRGILEQVDALIVTLEPCNHHGRTPPCSEAIIAAGIRNVVYGALDPNKDVAGGGARHLMESGVRVLHGVLHNECKQLMAYFAHAKTLNRPWITIKRAFAPDGSMIPPPGSKTFTSTSSLILAHRMRKAADVILTGSGTILADDPEFTVRHVPDHANVTRHIAVIDRRGRVPASYVAAAGSRGLECVSYHTVEDAMQAAAQNGKCHIMVEAGPQITNYMLHQGLWTLCVDMHRNEPDKVLCKFNPDVAIPFDVNDFSIDNILPPA